MNLLGATEIPGDIVYQPVVAESDRVSTYTGLDDHDTLFEARHGRGALDHVPRKSEEIVTSFMGATSTILGTGLMVRSMDNVKPTIDLEHTSQREHVSVTTNPLKHRVVSPSSEILGECAAIFTDMTETMLTALVQQLAMSSDTQKPKGIQSGNDVTVRWQIGDSQMEKTQGRIQTTSDQKETYPDLFLPVAENHQISDRFCGYSDSLPADNNPMVLVELKGLSY